jgi:multiple sugar transport system ATP-binding protein
VVVGVRAETIDLGGPVEATVDVVEPTGAAVLLTVTLGGHELKVQAPPTCRAQPGDRVGLAFHPDRMRLYDADTGMILEPV